MREKEKKTAYSVYSLIELQVKFTTGNGINTEMRENYNEQTEIW